MSVHVTAENYEKKYLSMRSRLYEYAFAANDHQLLTSLNKNDDNAILGWLALEAGRSKMRTEKHREQLKAVFEGVQGIDILVLDEEPGEPFATFFDTLEKVIEYARDAGHPANVATEVLMQRVGRRPLSCACGDPH